MINCTTHVLTVITIDSYSVSSSIISIATSISGEEQNLDASCGIEEKENKVVMDQNGRRMRRRRKRTGGKEKGGR